VKSSFFGRVRVRACFQVWVLTGDKMTTAINIGFSCRLLTNKMELITLDKEGPEDDRAPVAHRLKACYDKYGHFLQYDLLRRGSPVLLFPFSPPLRLSSFVSSLRRYMTLTTHSAVLEQSRAKAQGLQAFLGGCFQGQNSASGSNSGVSSMAPL